MKVFKNLSVKQKLLWLFNIIGFIILIFGLVLLYKQKQLLEDNYKVTIGTVIERQNRRGSSEFIVCEYYVNGERYTKSRQIDYYESENNVKVLLGDKFYVKYYPSDPEIAEIDLERGLLDDDSGM